MKTEEEHARRFNRGAQNHTTDRCPGRGQCMEMVLRLLDPRPEDVVLDIGCGPGTQLMGLSPSIREGLGLDPAAAMIQRATEQAVRWPNIHFHLGSAQRLPDDIRAAGINKIFSNYALHHLQDDAKRAVIRSLAELLSTAGMVVLGDLMFSDDPEQHESLFEVVGYGPGSDTPAYVSALEEMFASAGLRSRTHVLNPLVGVIVGRK